MIERGSVPWSLWANVLLTTGSIVVTVVTASMQIGPAIFSLVFILVWNYFLLGGVRWLWFATITVGALGIAANLATGDGTWFGDLIGLIALGLLVLPPTRRFFGKGEAATAT